jgi:hypothetical protein
LFTIIIEKYWLGVKNKQQVFIDFARDNGFDHLKARNWYEVDLSLIPLPTVCTLEYQ